MDRTYPSERRKAWDKAEKLAPNDPKQQQRIFDKEFPKLCAQNRRNFERKKSGQMGKRQTVEDVSYDISTFRRTCSGFSHFNRHD